MYCSHCHTTIGPFIKKSGPTKNNPNKKQYYNCNPCNTSRMNKYINTPNGKKKISEIVRRYVKKNPERVYAWQVVNNKFYKFQKNKIPCHCGNIKVDGHHPFPNQPRRVIWLCRFHHKQIHKKENWLKNYYSV